MTNTSGTGRRNLEAMGPSVLHHTMPQKQKAIPTPRQMDSY
jgi:hypothetical protein